MMLKIILLIASINIKSPRTKTVKKFKSTKLYIHVITLIVMCMCGVCNKQTLKRVGIYTHTLFNVCIIIIYSYSTVVHDQLVCMCVRVCD